MDVLALSLELALFGSMDSPRLVRGTPKVSITVYSLGVGLYIFWFLLLPFLLTFSILVLFAWWILTVDLSFAFAFTFSWR